MRKVIFLGLALLFIMGMVLAACGSDTDNESENENNGPTEGETDNEETAEDGEVTLVSIPSDSEIAASNIVKIVLEDEGYDVELLIIDHAPMWAGVADGSADASLAAWLPVTHEALNDEYGDQVEDLGANLEGAKIGLVVPEYVDIDSIEELKDNADKFNGQIVGAEGGSGVVTYTETAMEEYGIDNMELVTSTSASMAAELRRAYENEEWVVVTGWTPHWKFSAFDLKYLDDPHNVYGGEEEIRTIVRQGLAEDMPEVYHILDNFYWETDDIEAVMMEIEEGTDPEDAASEWLEANQDKVQEWVGG